MDGITASSPALAASGTGSAALVPENTRDGARENISAHYDLGNDLFASFLDERMMYSCAYFPRDGASLEEAQLAKLDRICERLQLGPDNHLLEVGTGWGGDGDPRRPQERLPGDDDDDLPRTSWRRNGSATRGSPRPLTVLLEDYRDLRGGYNRLDLRSR
ncbi:MAG: class I SAM-dependent methyltransferase [Solirubrobacterales bacterium]